MVISKYKCDISGGLKYERVIICTSSVCKNVIEKFVIAVLLSREKKNDIVKRDKV